MTIENLTSRRARFLNMENEDEELNIYVCCMVYFILSDSCRLINADRLAEVFWAAIKAAVAALVILQAIRSCGATSITVQMCRKVLLSHCTLHGVSTPTRRILPGVVAGSEIFPRA